MYIQEEAAREEKQQTEARPEYALYKFTASLDGALAVSGRGGMSLIRAGAAFTAGATVKQGGAIDASFEVCTT